MHNSYRDITSRITEDPAWFDENGVPRYGVFTPNALPDIYADECALVEIACQDCRTRYRVAFSSSKMSRVMTAMRLGQDHSAIPNRPIADAIRCGAIDYGDPPNHGHDEGCAGPTMTSDAVRVLEYWSRNDPAYVDPDRHVVTDIGAYMRWTRERALEIEMPQDAEVQPS